MADKKISALTSASTPLAGTEVLPVVQSSATVKATVENVFNATQPSGTAYGVVALNASKQAATSTGLKWQSSSLAINAGANAPNYNVEVVGSFRFQDTFAQNGYELSAGSTNILTSYNRTTGTWLTLRQRALTHEFYCDGSLGVTFTQLGGITSTAVYSTVVGGTNRDLFVDNAGVIGYVSSIRDSKINIVNFDNVQWLLDLNPVSFNYRGKNESGEYTSEASGELQYGLIAEDVESINPDLCFYDINEDGQKLLRGVSYSKLIAPMLKLIQQQQSQIENLQAQIAALKK